MALLWIWPASFLVLASPALFRKQTRGWVAVLMLVAMCDMIAALAGPDFLRVVFPGHTLHYNWGYKSLSLVFSLIVAIILIVSREFRSRELGLSFLQAPGTGRALLTVVLPYLVLLVVLNATLQGHTKDGSLETFLFQATMPGLAEEIAFRGIILALFDRMFAARFRVFGAELGYGAIATSLVFGLIHAAPFTAELLSQEIANALSATVIGFILVWIRCRSRSLVLPVVVHNLSNIIVDFVPRVI